MIKLISIGKESEYDFAETQSELIINKIKQLLDNNEKPDDILILSRFNWPLRKLKDDLKGIHSDIRAQTVHSAKGIQAKHVFIINLCSGMMGFPSEIQDDTVLEIIKDQNENITMFEEERRLFYVALTRSKENLYLFTQQGRESIFINEIRSYIDETVSI